MNIVITAGGTEEKIDEVRKITNMSTGKLAATICNKLIYHFFKNRLLRDHEIFYICNENSIIPSMATNLHIIRTSDTKSVEKEIKRVLENNKIDYFIHSMAISDYCVDSLYDKNMSEIDNSSKVSSNYDELFIKLKKTPKLIDKIKEISPDTALISFKLLNDVLDSKLIEIAREQLIRTNSDLVIANDLKNVSEHNHIAYAVSKDNDYKLYSKDNIGNYLTDYIISNQSFFKFRQEMINNNPNYFHDKEIEEQMIILEKLGYCKTSKRILKEVKDYCEVNNEKLAIYAIEKLGLRFAISSDYENDLIILNTINKYSIKEDIKIGTFTGLIMKESKGSMNPMYLKNRLKDLNIF